MPIGQARTPGHNRRTELIMLERSIPAPAAPSARGTRKDRPAPVSTTRSPASPVSGPLLITGERIKSWRDGAEGFFQWLADIRPRILTSRGRYEVIELAPFQVKAIEAALERRPDGSWKYTTIAFSFPRRHSKTLLMALMVIWRFTLNPNENIVVLSNSEKQSLSTGFKILKGIILNTSALLSQIGAPNIQRDNIQYPQLQSSIRAVTCSPASLYGERITCGWCSEIHAAFSDEPMQIISSSLGDSLNSWLLVDSTVDAIGGPLHTLETLQASGEDETVYVNRIEYHDLDEALKLSPPWLRRDWLRSRSKQLLPAVFSSQHLNQRTESDNALFSTTDIKRAQERLPMPFSSDDLKTLAAGRTYVVGGGLDRAYFGSLHGDSTIWTSTLKLAVAGEEPHFYVLNQKSILGSLGTLIKKCIAEDHKKYTFENTGIETYNAQDIFTWCGENQIPAEKIHAVNTNQTPAFTELYRIVKEGRLHFSDKLKDLAREMETFTYELKGEQPRFGINKKVHDDRVYSLAWSIFATRGRELAAYVLDSVICESKSRHAPYCFLRGGDLILNCGRTCPSFLKVQQMHLQHRRTVVESEITLPDFFKSLVKHDGLISYQGI